MKPLMLTNQGMRRVGLWIDGEAPDFLYMKRPIAYGQRVAEAEGVERLINPVVGEK